MKLSVFALFALLAIICLSTTSSAKSNKTHQGFPFKDENFSATLIIITEKELQEFQKSPKEGLKFNQISKVKRNEQFAIKIAFSGITQDGERKSDITFDFKMISPNNVVVSEKKNLTAFQDKTVNPLYIFGQNICHTQSDIEMFFDETDKAGRYKIIAEIQDNTGKKRIPLEKEIELVE